MTKELDLSAKLKSAGLELRADKHRDQFNEALGRVGEAMRDGKSHTKADINALHHLIAGEVLLYRSRRALGLTRTEAFAPFKAGFIAEVTGRRGKPVQPNTGR